MVYVDVDQTTNQRRTHDAVRILLGSPLFCCDFITCDARSRRKRLRDDVNLSGLYLSR